MINEYLLNAIRCANNSVLRKTIDENESILYTYAIDNKYDYTIKHIYLTPLMLTCYYKHYHLVQTILSYRDNSINYQNEFGYTALYYAIESDNIHIIRLLIEKGADLNIVDKKGYTPLIYASCHFCNYEMTKLLIDNNANVNHIDNNDYSVLMKICQLNNTHKYVNTYCSNVAQLLLDNGANINYINKKYEMAYTIAIQSNNTTLISVIENYPKLVKQ